MKKFILSAFALTLCTSAVFAQSKEELKAIKDQQKQISECLKAAEKASKLSEDAMGQIDLTKVPDFATARAKVAEALANPQAQTMMGDINRIAATIEYNQSKFALPGAQSGDQAALNQLFDNCGNGFAYYVNAWDAYAVPDAKGKTNTKFNEDMAAKASELYRMSNGLANCGFTAYNNQDWPNAAKFFEMACNGADHAILAFALQKNPLLAPELDAFKVDSVKYQNLLYAGSCYSNFDKVKSIATFKQLVGKNTPQAPVYSSIVGEYAQLKDTTEMINWLQKGMEVMPSEGYFSGALFQIYLERNDLDGAIAAMKKSLESNPNNAGLITIIARLYNQKGELAPAKEYFEKALAIEPDNLDANLYYGYTYLVEMEQGESEMLKAHARDAEIDKFSHEKMDAALPHLRAAFKADEKHENNDIPNLLMQVLYRKFAPTSAPNRQALINEYNEVADAYGRPRKD